MNGTANIKAFFSFGPDDSYISNSYEGLRHFNLPAALHNLLASGTVIDAYWGALGPVKESWVLSYKDKDGKYKLAYGDEIPWELADVFETLTPNPHLCVFLGPKESFIAWDATFIRWVGLPSALEGTIQGWLTPAGWRAGPPRLVTWGSKGAFFAISEYGEAEYRLGSNGRWPLFADTIEEWEDDAKFEWSELAYITIDATTLDQFLAIREDRIWAGTIADGNEDALQSFASNYFARARTKPRPNPDGANKPNEPNQPSNPTPSPADQALYEQWESEVATAFASALIANGGKGAGPKKLQIRSQKLSPTTKSIPPVPTGPTEGKLLDRFPYLPARATTCALDACKAAKEDPAGVKACRHDVERLFRASGLYSYEWLRQERIRWHPDRFGRLCDAEWREKGRRLAEEMFKIIDSLITDLEETKAGRA